MKDIRPIIFVCLVIIASLLLAYPYLVKTGGVIVTHVDTNSACKDVITTDSIITEVTGIPIKNSNEFNSLAKNLRGPITLIINGNPRSCNIPENSSLILTVSNVKTSGLKLSVELGGGTYFLFKPEKDATQNVLQDVLKIVELRTGSYNLINTFISLENGSIKIVSGPEEEEYAKILMERGFLEGGIAQMVDFTNKKSEFTLNESTYEVSLKRGKIIVINGSEYDENQDFKLGEWGVRIGNISNNSTVIFVKIFTNGDLTLSKDETSSTGTSRIIKQDSGYVFVVPVILSNDASEKFAGATKGQEIIINPGTGEGFLKSPLSVLIDGNTFIELPIRSVDAGKPAQELILWGYKQTTDVAVNNMLRLNSIVEFKGLPVELKLLEIGQFQPHDREFYLSLLLYGGLIPAIILLAWFFFRYKRNGIVVLPLILLCLSEIVFILGTMTVPWFIFLIFFLGVFFIVLRGEIKGLNGWVSLILMFIMSIGIAITKLILDPFSILGMTAVLLISFILETIVTEKVLNKTDTTGGLKKYSEKLWWFFSIATIILLFVFFVVDELRGLTTVVFIGILALSNFTVPIYLSSIERISKKIKISSTL